MEESGALLFRCLSREPYCERMKNDRIPVKVFLPFVSFDSNFKTKIYHNFVCLLIMNMLLVIPQEAIYRRQDGA